MSTFLDNITRRLAVDPYRIDLLVERLLFNAAQGDTQAAQADMGTLQRLGAARTFSASLAQAACGKLRVLQEMNAYVMFDPALEPAIVGWSVHFLRAARAAADQFFGPFAGCLVVEISRTHSGLHHASSEVPGIGYIKLSARSSLVEHEAVIAHEMAHVYLTSGNRFLDEGIAVFFQGRLNGGRIFVGTEFECMTVLDRSRDQVLPLRALLAHDGRHDVFFERLAPDEFCRNTVYAAGYALCSHLVDCVRVPGLKALCATLRSCPATASHPSLIAQFLGKGIEELDCILLKGRAGSAIDSVIPAIPRGDVPAATLIWTPLTSPAVNDLIANFRARLIDDAAATAVKRDLVRLLVRRVLDRHAKVPAAADLAEARSLLYELNVDIACSERERVLLEGWVAIAQTHAAASVAVRIVSWERAVEILRTALARFPDDGEVLCTTATLHLRGPEEYGGNRGLAEACLNRARQIPGWSDLADTIERNHANATVG